MVEWSGSRQRLPAAASETATWAVEAAVLQLRTGESRTGHRGRRHGLSERVPGCRKCRKTMRLATVLSVPAKSIVL